MEGHQQIIKKILCQANVEKLSYLNIGQSIYFLIYQELIKPDLTVFLYVEIIRDLCGNIIVIVYMLNVFLNE